MTSSGQWPEVGERRGRRALRRHGDTEEKHAGAGLGAGGGGSSRRRVPLRRGGPRAGEALRKAGWLQGAVA